MIEITFYLLLLLLATVPVIKALAKRDKFFTEGRSNYIKYVERAGVFDHFIPETPGYYIKTEETLQDGTTRKLAVRDVELVEAKTDEEKRKCKLSFPNSVLHRILGIYWYGIYPIKQVSRISIQKDHDNPQGTKPENWITKGKKVDEDGIRHLFPRTFVFTSVELPDRTKIDLKLVVKFRLVRPYIPMYEFRSDFFTQTSLVLQSEVIDTLVEQPNFSIDVFLSEQKGEVDGLLAKYKNSANGERSELNKTLVEQVGLEVVGININDWNPGDDETMEAIRQKAIERLRGEARVEKATKDADSLRITTDADVDRITRLGVARGSEIRQTVEAFAASNADGATVAQSAMAVLQSTTAVLEMEAVAKTKLTTLVKDRASVVVPAGGSGSERTESKTPDGLGNAETVRGSGTPGDTRGGKKLR